MRFCRVGFLHCLMAVAFVIVIFNGTSYAELSVSINGVSTAPSPTPVPLPSSMPAPSGPFRLTATVSLTGTSVLSRVVFYRNDVPYKTVSGSTPYIDESQLGSDTYTYRARAYDDLQNSFADSNDIKLTVNTPRVFRMGDTIPGSSPSYTTSGPDRFDDHTEDIEKALLYLSAQGGGTLFFPCSGGPVSATFPNGDGQSIYNIKRTIEIPSNVTLQGESAEEGIYNGHCRMYWNDDVTTADTGCYAPSQSDPLRSIPMFKVKAGKTGIRFRDLWMVSRTIGRDCGGNGSSTQIYNDNTTAILLDAESSGTVSDVVFENVSMTAFTYGIKAIGNTITDIKMRGVKPVENFRQLYINATYAYDWDVQNFNLGGMMGKADEEIEDVRQGAVEIINAGAPPNAPVENKKIKFLQLNCNGSNIAFANRPGFCLKVRKHGGLYFKQLHMEGTQKSLIVEDLGTQITNTEPIIMEHSPVVGEFNDDSMKLYLVGNFLAAAPDPVQAQTVNHPDKARMEFIGAGRNSTVVDCGDLHGDRTDTHTGEAIPVNDPVEWGDWRMSFTHSERNRESFFEKISTDNYLPKAHTVCPANVPGLPDINQIGGEHFNIGVLPVDYTSALLSPNSFGPCTADTAYCATELQKLLTPESYSGLSPNNRGTIRINGLVKVDQTIKIPSGRQIVGGDTVNGNAPELRLELTSAPLTPVDLLQINMNYYIPATCPPASPPCSPLPIRVSGITIRNLKLSTNNTTTSGIAIVGLPFTNTTGVSSDMHFSGLTIGGFGKGLDVRRYSTSTTHQMVDGVSWKNINFVNNVTAASVVPQNVSNWNIINLNMESNSYQAVGWYHANTGNSMQNVTCSGTESFPMKDCIRLEMAGTYLTGLKRTENVENDLTFAENYPMYSQQYLSRFFSNSVLRNNDFTAKGEEMGAVNFKGKAFITSMNNRYKNILVDQDMESQAEFSRITYCGDFFEVNNEPFPGFEEYQDNLYVGVQTPALITCGNNSSTPRPKPWEPVINLSDPTETVYGADIPLIGNFNDNVLEDLVVYRQTAQSKFIVSSPDGRTRQTISWGLPGDIPLTGRFIPNYRSQVVAWREVPSSNSQVWIYNPQTTLYFSVNYGINGDKPFVGNFLDESGSVSGNMDEIAVYRPSNGQVYIDNPRTTAATANFALTANNPTPIQVGDFLGLGFDQVAQFNNGTWTIVNPRNSARYTASFGSSGDMPFTGKFLSGNCTQLGVWNETTELITIHDPVVTPVGGAPAVASCGNRQQEMYWGSNNNGPSNYETTGVTDCPSGNCPNDILLKINTPNSTVYRPTAYRPTNGVYPYGKAKGQWWIHDPF